MARQDPKQSLPQRARALMRRTHLFVTRDLWSVEAGGLPTFRALSLGASRVLFIALRGFRSDRCMFHAAALTYITVLSIVPVLAFMFSMAKGLGAYDTLVERVIQPALEQVFPVEEGSPPQLELALEGESRGVSGGEIQGVSGDVSGDVSQGESGDVSQSESGDGEEAGGLRAVEVGSATTSVRATIDQILEFVSKTDVSKLGFFGFAVLLWAVVKLLGSVERSFNEIWGVPSSRTVVRKISDYLAIVVVIPIFLLTASAITASEQSVGAVNFMAEKLHLGPLFDFLLRAFPLVVVWVAFTFIYMCLPNKRMRLSSALVGGIGGGTLWQLLQVAHFNLQASTANFNALYAGFAAIPIFLVWIYLSWVMVLFGAELASAHQKAPTYRGSAYIGPLESAFEEVLALRALTLIARAFLRGDRAFSVPVLSEWMHVPELWIEEVVDKLVDGKILARIGDEVAPGVQPARALDSISVMDVLLVLRGSRKEDGFPPRKQSELRVQRLLSGLDEELRDSARNHSLRDLGEEAIRDEEGETESAPAGLPEPL